MRRSWIGWAAAALIAVGGAAMAWVWFAGGSGDPSTDLTTPPVATTTTTGSSDTTSDQGTTTTLDAGEATAYVIDPQRSTATYEIDEILRGNPNRVVGVTDQVAGQVLVELSDPASVRFSTILINARTFVTDSSQRDRVVRGPVVLNSADEEFELITFEVTGVEGIDGEISIGDQLALRVTGDLTIKGATNPTTFEVTVTLVDESTISGVATAVVLRTEFGIGIPSVPSVAGVTDEVDLRLEFVAVAG